MNELIHILPLLILAGFSILLLVVITLVRNYVLTAVLAATAYVMAFLSILYTGDQQEQAEVLNLLIVDGFGRFFLALILFSGLVISILAFSYMQEVVQRKEEYQVILILGSLGAGILVFSNHFLSFFLGLELLSVSIYVLVSFTRERQNSIEAAIKYLLLAGVASAFLLMGMALVYAVTGSIDFNGINVYVNQADVHSLLFYSGFGLILTGIGFKMALVPFHLWTPDVYEGAPAPTTAFIATISKASVVVILLRFYLAINGGDQQLIVYILSGIAFLSMMTGNLLALLQKDLKRLLAYSSIAHLGYILVALIAGKDAGIEAVSFYVVAYLMTILAAFGIVSAVSRHDRECSAVDDYRALFWERPLLSAAFVIILLSLAGIPLTVGFIGKYYLLYAGLADDHWFLVITLILSSVIGLYYYLRVIVKMFEPVSAGWKSPLRTITAGGSITLSLLTAMIIFYGTYPAWLADLIRSIIITTF